jgi:hypothetical protein
MEEKGTESVVKGRKGKGIEVVVMGRKGDGGCIERKERGWRVC